jgi:tRNA 2-thiouridine synthesizing protein A
MSPVTMSDTDIEPDETVDARGAACPGPLMDLIGKIRSVDSGAVVLLLSDNEQSLTDVSEWAEEAGNDLLAVEELDDHYEFYVEKA